MASTTRRTRTQLDNDIGRAQYLDGIRGLAAVIVVAQHFVIPFVPDLDYGYGSPTENRNVLHLPIIRLLYNGSAVVPIFFVISGLVVTLKIRRLLQTTSRARSLASFAGRRAVRLFGPPLIGSFAMMLGAHLQAFDIQSRMTYRGDPIMRPIVWDSQPKRLPTLRDQLTEWLTFVRSDLLIPRMWHRDAHQAPRETAVYGFQLWTVPVEFWSSMLLIVALMGLSQCRKRVRILSLGALAVLCAWVGRWETCLFLAGSIIAESAVFHNNSTSKEGQHRWLWASLLGFGLFLASFPDADGGKTPGFIWLAPMSVDPRFWTSVGTVMIVVAATRMAALQRLLWSPGLLYLGRISYAVYNVHVPILSSFGWMLMLKVLKITGKYTALRMGSGLAVTFLLLVLPICVLTAHVFAQLVERPCARWARRW